MGSVETRPAQPLTEDNLLIGVPFVEFSPKTGSNPDTFGAFRDLGIVQDAAIAKELNVIALRSAHSGISKLVRELVQQFDARLNVSVFQFDGKNMQLFFASTSESVQSGGDVAIVDEAVTLGAFPDWADLGSRIKDSASWTALDPAQITLEVVTSSAPGSPFGETTGDFALDFKPLLITDVTLYQETLGTTVTNRTADLVAGSTPLTTEIAIVVGTGATSGEITYFTAEGPAAGTVIEVTYQPTHTLTENTDYVVDFIDGRIRQIGDGSGTQVLKDNQPVLADYTTNQLSATLLAPYTQFIFEGRARIKLLTDVGINMIWTIPKAEVRLTDDDFTFSREEFAAGSLSVAFLEDSTAPANPFGQLEVYDENAA